MEIITKRFIRHGDDRGQLIAIEGDKDLGFPIKRVYYIFETLPDVRRGFHAHKALQQYLICMHGSCKILLDDGHEKTVVELNDPAFGLYIGPSTWREMYDFEPGTVLTVLASMEYDESDYIRDYETFLCYIEKTESVKGEERA